MALGPNPNLRLRFSASVPGGLAPKPFLLGAPEPHHKMLPAIQEETLPLGTEPSLQSRRNLHPIGHLRLPLPRETKARDRVSA